MTQKLMIIVLVALAVIFLITLGIGGCHRSGPPDPDRAGFVRSLKGLQGNRFLQIGDKASTTCVQANAVIVRVNGTCQIFLQKRAFFRRSTRVAFRRCLDAACQTLGQFPFPFQVSVNPRKGPTQSDQVGGETCYGTAIGRSGGTITLTGNATISLQRPGCPSE